MKRLLACLFVSLAAYLLAPASAFAQQETRYTVILVGNPAGFQTSTVKPDGTREFAFEYNDRGRGPKYRTTIRLDAQGLPVSLDTSGNDYLKAPVSETFTFENGVARWKNSAEAGEKRLAANAFYNSMNGAPEEFALHRELELYEEAGIPANEVLRIATIGAARVMKRDGELGSIALGKLADLILVDGDPARRVSDIRRVTLVVKDGVVYEPAALYKSIGVRP
ncbi:MAG: hypothetical protein QOH49_3822 [Acidobacteriota bacterium]|jgi:hypothetical protein|nr:hypothetical protein [Acidobacteriota bacterium]